jgi:3-methyladenine DNA glycosylase AlkC
MPTDSAKGPKKEATSEEKTTPSEEKTTASEDSGVQHELLAAIKRSQEAALKVVSSWSESVQKLAPSLPDMPKLPLVDSLPKPEEISDQFFAFAQKMMDTQQEFVKRLIDVLPGHENSKS